MVVVILLISMVISGFVAKHSPAGDLVWQQARSGISDVNAAMAAACGFGTITVDETSNAFGRIYLLVLQNQIH